MIVEDPMAIIRPWVPILGANGPSILPTVSSCLSAFPFYTYMCSMADNFVIGVFAQVPILMAMSTFTTVAAFTAFSTVSAFPSAMMAALFGYPGGSLGKVLMNHFMIVVMAWDGIEFGCGVWVCG